MGQPVTSRKFLYKLKTQTKVHLHEISENKRKKYPITNTRETREFQPKYKFIWYSRVMFRSSHFSFLVTFGDKVTKIQKYYVIFVYILQGKMGKTKNNRKENYSYKVAKIPKTKRRKYGMNETIV